MQSRIEQLEYQLNALITQFLPPVLSRLEALETAAKEKEGVVKKRHPLTADVYDTVCHLNEHGMSEKDIAKELNLPYTTVRAYLRLSPERVTKLRAKQIAQVRQQTSERAAQAEKADRLAKAEAKVKVEAEAPSSSVKIGMALTHDDYGDDYGIEEGQFKEVESYLVECPASPDKFGEAGWWEWTEDLKQHATSSRQADGYPCYYPVERNTLLTIMYMNEVIERGVLSQDVDWTTDGGVLRWKIASS